MSIRMALGFRPSDLRGDRHLKREPCTKTYKTQRIITVRYDDLYPLTNSYKVMDAIDPYDGSDTFDDIPEESLSPVDLCPFELDHPDWTIKGLVCPSSTKGEFMAAAITDAFLNSKHNRETYMVLLEREVKCECHKRWRPDHNLRVVRDTKHQKKAKEKTRSTGYTPWTSSSNYFDGGLNAGMIAMMSSSGAGCGGMVSSGGDCCGGDGGCC